MATQFKSDQSFAGAGSIGDSVLAGRSTEDIFDSYSDRVHAAGGVIAHGDSLRSILADLVAAGIFEQCRFFDMVDAAWGATEENNSLTKAFSLRGAIDMAQMSYYYASADSDDDPGVPLITDDDFPYWKTLQPGNGRNAIYKGLISDEFTITNGGYYVIGTTYRNASGDQRGPVSLSSRAPADGDSAITDQVAAPAYCEMDGIYSVPFLPDGTRSGLNPQKSSAAALDGTPLTKTMFINESTATYGRFFRSSSDDVGEGSDSYVADRLINPRGKRLTLAANSLLGQYRWGGIKGDWPTSYCNFFVAVAMRPETINLLHQIIAKNSGQKF